MSLKNPSLLPRYEALRVQLQNAIVEDANAGEVLQALRTLDNPPPVFFPGNRVAEAAPHVELAFAWHPESIPLSLYMYCNNEPVPGAMGIFSGGRLFVPIPAPLLKPRGAENEVVAFMRFMVGRWKYQLWMDVDGQRKRVDQGRDTTSGSADDDSFIRTVRFGGRTE
ncbi:hypothetical protein [Corallococcus terminator]|uniref:Uncharacterized protein n=1 Tax=Corallococcus terminator TaxID=2316733 RepID=A0A3A8IS97_9BACT|nr:hypothetical protein [Corallococcus terminator]RKG86195.1 hypothetical protein D7V88_18350 [Corallococcus terminator]